MSNNILDFNQQLAITLTIITYDLISYHLPLTLELTNESEIQDILTSLSALIITVIYLEVIIRLLLYYY